ncbi:MAG: leucine-rich repeat domain-containing protein [Clostridia bacterium]|nr:leucine-rich repeat domain-containing protein [Clostridia bacterium]
MKRFLLLVLSLAITVFGMALVGCQPSTQPSHEHIWETTYSSDNFSHWIKCEGCDEVKDIADHNLQNSDTCSVCGTTTVPTEGVTYKIVEQVAQVTGYTGDSDKVRIAATYQGKPVTAINSYAFQEYFDKKITAVYIPNSVTTIGGGAFSGCAKLEKVSLGSSITSIGASAFADCSELTDIVLPNTVTSIGAGAFANCSNLTSVSIPDSVTSFGDIVFMNCEKFQFNVYEGLNYVGNSNNPYLVLTDIPSAIQFNSSFNLHNDTKVFASNLFSGCGEITTLDLPDSLIAIPDCTFMQCQELKTITIPSSVKSVGNFAFSQCSALESIYVPDSVTSVGTQVFEHCENLKTVTLPANATYVGNVFNDCPNIVNLTAPFEVFDSLLSFDKEKMESVTFNSGDTISAYSFNGCDALTSVIIPSSVTTIESHAFDGCNNAKIYCEVDSKPDGWKNSWNNDCPVYYYSENEPTTDGNYWRYVNGEVVIWE